MFLNLYNYESIPTGYYDDIFHKKKGVQSCWHFLKFLKVRESISSASKKILDIGCGPGTFLGNFAPESAECIGVDISSNQIEFATKKYGNHRLQFQKTDGLLPYPENHFDTITSIELIEHLNTKEVKTLLQECHRVLKPGGQLVLTTPNYKSFWVILEKLVNRFSPVSYEHQHITHFSKKKLLDYLEKQGFKPKIRSYLGLSPFLAIISWRLALLFSRFEMYLENSYGFLLIAVCTKKENDS